ncbi:hypothetical protein Q5P01_023884 [Channa striata]|uniref:Uncharacterized protein n=1 Tax=Channa striata TaxID=64152 RepID=A0AA88LP32_CHASR|nr:hypothetical protein Q5P01_023884 [Channa striata]
MGAVGVLLIYVLTVCLAKGSCLAGSDTNDGQESGLHRTLRDVFPNENSIKKALRLFHSMKTVVQVQLAANEVADNLTGSPAVVTTTSEENGHLSNQSATVSSYDATTVFSDLVADVPAGNHEATTTLPALPQLTSWWL